MSRLTYEFINNIPVFKCDYCGKCSKLPEGTSYIHEKNRGCCWYFPKYDLVDIKNILNVNGRHFIEKLLNSNFSHTNRFSIQTEGYFNRDQYEEYISLNPDTRDFDPSLFFKLCPFFGNNGCSLEFSLRPHPCNFYLCRPVVNSTDERYRQYKKERKDYFAYCNYFNEFIKDELIESGFNLIDNPEGALNIIEDFHLPPFDEGRLGEINIEKIVEA